MADFLKAYHQVMVSEGLYANNPNDAGGETWKGIARNMWPMWEGWREIDEIKDNEPVFEDFIFAMADDIELERKVQTFYKINFWNRLYGDRIDSQAVAERLFNIAVNCGVGKAALWLQMTLNALNFSPRLIPMELAEDGILGNMTFKALDTFLKVRKKYEPELVLALEGLQRYFYLDLALRHDSQKNFIIGWLRRTKTSDAA